MNIRRPFTRAFVCIALGLVASLLAAWAMAFQPLDHTAPPIPIRLSDPPEPDSTRGIQFCRFGFSRYEWLPWNAPLKPDDDIGALLSRSHARIAESLSAPPGMDARAPIDTLVQPDTWPEWTRLPRARAADSGMLGTCGISADVRGFPCPAFRCWTILETSRGSPVAHPVQRGITMRAPTGAMNTNWAALPLEPDPPGLIADTLFYATCFFFVGPLFRALKDAAMQDRRTIRNQCTVCGYSRGGLSPAAPCPECGRPSP